jgi:DNA-binding YbaB/EbfC family protein
VFKNLGGFGNMAALLGQAQQIPEKMKQLTEEMKRERIHGTAGGGAVQVEINGIGQMQSIRIDPAARDNPELEAWIVEACNAAGARAKQLYMDSVSKMASDMNIKIPGLDGVLANLTGGA